MLPRPLAGLKGAALRQEGKGNGWGKGWERRARGLEEGRERDGRDEGRGKGDKRNGMEGERRGWAGGKGKGGEGLHPKLQLLVPPLNAIRHST